MEAPLYPEDLAARLAILAGGPAQPPKLALVPNSPVDLDAAGKAYSTLQARAALAGWQLVQMSAGDFVIERWGAVRALPDAAAVDAFLRQVGAPA